MKVGNKEVSMDDFLKALVKALDDGSIVVHVHEEEVCFFRRKELLN